MGRKNFEIFSETIRRSNKFFMKTRVIFRDNYSNYSNPREKKMKILSLHPQASSASVQFGMPSAHVYPRIEADIRQGRP